MFQPASTKEKNVTEVFFSVTLQQVPVKENEQTTLSLFLLLYLFFSLMLKKKDKTLHRIEPYGPKRREKLFEKLLRNMSCEKQK